MVPGAHPLDQEQFTILDVFICLLAHVDFGIERCLLRCSVAIELLNEIGGGLLLLA
jgi:hypothetical protein